MRTSNTSGSWKQLVMRAANYFPRAARYPYGPEVMGKKLFTDFVAKAQSAQGKAVFEIDNSGLVTMNNLPPVAKPCPFAHVEYARGSN